MEKTISGIIFYVLKVLLQGRIRYKLTIKEKGVK